MTVEVAERNLGINQRPLMQRVGLFAWLVLVVAVLVAHSPWEGYWYIDPNGIPFEVGDAAASDEWFWSWTSQAPLVRWFGAVSHALIALAVVTGLAGAWFYLFGKTEAEA